MLLSILSTLIVLSSLYKYITHLDIFWDLSIYERAVSDIQNGISPYRHFESLNFVYHPIVAHTFNALNHIIPLHSLMLLMYITSITLFLWQLNVFRNSKTSAGFPRSIFNSQKKSRRVQYIGLINELMPALAFGGGIGILSIFTGNITLYLHFALLASLIWWAHNDTLISKNLPTLLIAIFSIIKPYFLLYLLVTFFISDNKKSPLIQALFSILFFSICWGLFYFINPLEHTNFINALKDQSLSKNDIGYSFFAIFRVMSGSDLLALIVHFIFITILSTTLYRNFKGTISLDTTDKILLLYFLLTLANPRMKEYDLFPALICFFFFIQYTFKKAAFLIFVGVFISSIGALNFVFRKVETFIQVDANYTKQVFSLLLMISIIYYEIHLKRFRYSYKAPLQKIL